MLMAMLLQAVFGSGMLLLGTAACTLLQFWLPGHVQTVQTALGAYVAALLRFVIDILFSAADTTMSTVGSALGKSDECKLCWVRVTGCGGFGLECWLQPPLALVLSAGCNHLPAAAAAAAARSSGASGTGASLTLCSQDNLFM